MRTCDVMSSPVVTVPPDAPLKDVAATLVEHGINAVPVVDAGERRIGIVTEADLLSLETGLGRGPVPVMAGERVVGMVARRDLLRLIARSDHDIQADLERRLKKEILALQRLAVRVTGGVVTIDAAAGPLARQLLQGLARTVPGVVEVHTTHRGADGAKPPRGTNGDR
jgi:CBS domain-containing protein